MKRAKAIGWSVGGQIATTIASLASTVILARILTPTDYGVFAYALAIYSTAQWLLQMGMSQYVLREAELTPGKLNGAFAISALQGLAATIIVAALAPVAGWFGGSALIGWVTLSVALVPFLNAPESISDAYWVRNSRFAGVAILQIAKATIQTMVSVAVEWTLHWGAYSLVIGLLAASLLSFVVASWVLLVEARSRPVIDRDQWIILRSFGSKSFALTLGQAGSTQLPALVIGRLLGVASLGYFNRASAALDTIARTLVGATARVTAPRFFRQVNEGVPYPYAVAEMQELILFIIWPALAGMAALSGPVIRLLYGPQWGLAATALPMLCLGFAIDQARAGGMETLLARDRIGLNARIELIRTVYAIAFMVIGAHWGFMGVLWGRVADAVVSFIVYCWAMWRLDALPIKAWPKLFGGNLLLALAAGLPAALFMAHWGWPVVLSIGDYAVAIGLSALAWTITAAAIRHPYFLAGLETARARLGRAA